MIRTRRRFARLVFVVGLACAIIAPRAQTPAAPPFFFIQLSDPQFGMYTANREFSQETANFEFAIATVNRLKPAFVIITGDLVHKPGDSAQIAEYQRITAKLDPNITLYNVAGNHDVENIPTPESLAAYTKIFGPDRYTFRNGPITGIVLNSSLIHSPQGAPAHADLQEAWLDAELAGARARGARHLVVFQHHPWFLTKADEPDQYFNIPLVRRARYLARFREFGVRYLFSGHYHRNAGGRAGDVEMITTGPVGRAFEPDRSGLRVVIVRDSGIEHTYHEFGDLPNVIK